METDLLTLRNICDIRQWNTATIFQHAYSRRSDTIKLRFRRQHDDTYFHVPRRASTLVVHPAWRVIQFSIDHLAKWQIPIGLYWQLNLGRSLKKYTYHLMDQHRIVECSPYIKWYSFFILVILSRLKEKYLLLFQKDNHEISWTTSKNSNFQQHALQKSTQ